MLKELPSWIVEKVSRACLNPFATIQDGSSLSIYLDKIYELPVNLKLDNANYNGEAIINFISEDEASKTIVYP